MRDKEVNILSTRPLELSINLQAAKMGIIIDSVSFINTEPVRNNILQRRITEIARQSSAVVFTSMNAAEAVAAYTKNLSPQWNIYCLGTATKEIVFKHFPLGTISGEAKNASSLADEIIKNSVQDLIFFCGDQRRVELPEKLASQHIRLEEIVVYKTVATPEKIGKEYNGILFFSPSAVESFFSVNTVPGNTVLFAIGSTTSRSIRQYCDNKIIQSELPGKKNLAEKAIHYFGKSNHTNEHIKK